MVTSMCQGWEDPCTGPADENSQLLLRCLIPRISGRVGVAPLRGPVADPHRPGDLRLGRLPAHPARLRTHAAETGVGGTDSGALLRRAAVDPQRPGRAAAR